jgi:preprotein translocase SecF subunit
VIGYSVNDTIVIFDRIRENLRTVYGKTFGEIANLSINQSLNRTIITSLTSFIVVTVMYMVGGKGLNDFALTLMIGIIFGTYSSSFVATPIVYEWHKWKGVRAEREKAQKGRVRYQRTSAAK